MPSDRYLRAANGLHRVLQRVSGNRLGWRLVGMTVIELTTVGRKSGEQQVSMLTSPLKTDGSWVVVASRGGDPTNPSWFLNLVDHPEVLVRIGGPKQRPAVAKVATPAERAELWPRVIHAYPNYGEYQRKTTREIPLVLLTPR